MTDVELRRSSGDEFFGAAVEAEGLVKTYRSRTGTVEAVRGVDLRVSAGEIVAGAIMLALSVRVIRTYD
jgi:hypothetical protein